MFRWCFNGDMVLHPDEGRDYYKDIWLGSSELALITVIIAMI